jgi:hypothetical protein
VNCHLDQVALQSWFTNRVADAILTARKSCYHSPMEKTPLKLTGTQIRWFRFRCSGLAEPFSSPEEAARSLVGVQAQILPAAGLALWNRTRGLTYADFDDRLHDRRSLVKLWGQRGTLHVYASDEWPLLIGAMVGRHSWWERQMVRAGTDLDDYQATLDRVAELLHQRGTMGRSDLRASGLDLDEACFNPWGGIFADLVRRGVACHAGQAGNEKLFAHREYWLPDLAWNPPPADEANIELARRYLHTYGPATVPDLKYWRSARAGDAQRWMAALRGETVEVNVGGQPMLALRADLDALNEKPPARREWPVRMLYRFDPLLLGIKDRSWLMEPRYYKRVSRPAGHIEGTLLEHGRVVGTWRYNRADSGLAITVYPFVPLPRQVKKAVEENAAGVAQFLGLPLNDLVMDGV